MRPVPPGFNQPVGMRPVGLRPAPGGAMPAGVPGTRPPSVNPAQPNPATPPPVAAHPTPQVSVTPPQQSHVNPAAPNNAPAGDPKNEFLTQMQRQLLPYLIQKINPALLTPGNEHPLRQQIEQLIDERINADKMALNRQLRDALVKRIQNEMTGFGPLEDLLSDSTISEIMVNGSQVIYVEQKGKITLSPIKFVDDASCRRVIDKILSPLGRRVDESSPICDARLPDGSRVNVVVPPCALNGPTITIRKFSKNKLTMDKLIEWKAMSSGMALFLQACARGALNIVISGGTGSGKTTALNALSSYIPNTDRIITVEDAAELALLQDHVVRLEAKPANIEGKGAVSIRDLVKSCLRMRPDRIVIGECRGGEALDMLQAMNTGHDGSLTTTHANSPREALARLSTLVLMAGVDLPEKAIKEQIAGAVHMFVQCSRLQDGSRRWTYITEVQGMEGEVITLQDIFKFEQTGLTPEGKVKGVFRGMGIVPKCIDKLRAHGENVPVEIFSSVLEV